MLQDGALFRAQPNIKVPHQGDKKLRYYTSLLCLASLATISIFSVAMNTCIVDMVESVRSYREVTNSTETGDQVATWQPEVFLREVSSVKLQQMLYIASLIGGQPTVLISGSLADRYGSKLPMFVTLVTVAVTCLFTPLMTRYSLISLVIARVPYSIALGTIVPSVYDFANRWLTDTEKGIFTSAIRASYGIGAIIGSLLPGGAILLGYSWEAAFYATGVLLLMLSIIWYIVITSSPQDNPFITEAELKLIQKEKALNPAPRSTEKKRVPWLQIMTHPSVIAHMIVKFTCELGLEVYCIEISIYLREMHGASQKQISIISSIHSTIHVFFITPIAWVANSLVKRRALGFGKTAWRKIFQGSCHLLMATGYLMIPFVWQDNLLTGLAFGLIITTWMLSVGCEPHIPFDLTRQYPTTIIGIVQAVSGFSMTFVTSMSSWILDGSLQDPECWNTLFRITGYIVALGGLVFVLVYKAELFLAEELEGVVTEEVGILEMKSRAQGCEQGKIILPKSSTLS